MTLQYCPECNNMQEFNGDFCTKCGRKYTKRDLLEIIESQLIIIDNLKNKVTLSAYVIGTMTYPEYFSNDNVN